jgi:NTP pyrophosphatase (non-canonical NTP hydrolase)
VRPDVADEIPLLSSIKEWQIYIHEWAKRLGWWELSEEQTRTPGELIALMHSELSEALEDIRNGLDPSWVGYPISGTWADDPSKPAGFGIELADCVIRILDTCERYGIDLEKCLQMKMQYNEQREYRHGGKKL